MSKLLAIILFFIVPVCASAQKTDLRLKKKIDGLIKEFNGGVGVYVQHLRTKKVVAINADSLFPTASMVKIPIMIGIAEKINNQELEEHQPLVYKDSLLYAGVDILGSFRSNEKIELGKLILLMLSTSDNTASLWLQSLAGGGTTINLLLAKLGFTQTRVNSRTPGREVNQKLYGWGQTSPREMAGLLTKIYYGDIINPASSQKMLRWLGRNYWDDVAISQVPSEIFVASKNGAVDRSRSEVLLVRAPHGPYVFCISTRDLQDTTWKPENEAWVLTRKLSALLWNHYEPRDRPPSRLK
jgi:beta-lactamase class A